MSDTPEYILRPGVKFIPQKELFRIMSPEGKYCDDWCWETVRDCFVPLDRQALTEQLLKLIEDHNDGLLFTASSCSDYFREEEARGLLSWATAKSEDGNSMNTFLAKEIMVLFGLENKETE